MTIENIAISVPTDCELPTYRERSSHSMKQKPSSTKLALRQILDRWVACTISVEDAETELWDLFATVIGSADVESGTLKIKSERGLAYDTKIEIDGKPFDWGNKLTLIIEAGRKNRIIFEGCPVNFAAFGKTIQ